MSGLADYVSPIRSGLEPSTGGGALNAERLRQLNDDLRNLQAARNRAAVEIRSYPVGGAS